MVAEESKRLAKEYLFSGVCMRVYVCMYVYIYIYTYVFMLIKSREVGC